MSINTNNSIGNAINSYQTAKMAKNSDKTASKPENVREKKPEEAKTAGNEAARKTGNYGKTIGKAKLSKEGARYYEELKKKFGNMDFILVSKDMKEQAEANSAAYANPEKTVVLIDEEKIEQMATDEKFRAQYEGLIEKASANLENMKTSMANSGQSNNILGYGMEIKDNGEISYFAVLRKSSEAQKEHIEKVTEKHRTERKEAAKKAEKAALEKKQKVDDKEVIKADSIEELMQRISEYNFDDRSNSVVTEQEQSLGQSIDFKG